MKPKHSLPYIGDEASLQLQRGTNDVLYPSPPKSQIYLLENTPLKMRTKAQQKCVSTLDCIDFNE